MKAQIIMSIDPLLPSNYKNTSFINMLPTFNCKIISTCYRLVSTFNNTNINKLLLVKKLQIVRKADDTIIN